MFTSNSKPEYKKLIYKNLTFYERVKTLIDFILCKILLIKKKNSSKLLLASPPSRGTVEVLTVQAENRNPYRAPVHTESFKKDEFVSPIFVEDKKHKTHKPFYNAAVGHDGYTLSVGPDGYALLPNYITSFKCPDCQGNVIKHIDGSSNADWICTKCKTKDWFGGFSQKTSNALQFYNIPRKK